MINDKMLFNKVFERIEIDDFIRKKFLEVIVKEVCIDKNKNFLNIILESERILDEKNIIFFKNLLFKNFSYIKNIEIEVFYNVDISLDEKINFLWTNILTKIEEISPLCFNALKESIFFIENNILNIKVKNNSSFYFHQKFFDKLIENYFNKSFKECIKVKIIDFEITKEDRENYLKRLIEKENNLSSFTEKNINLYKVDNQNIVENKYKKINNTPFVKKTRNIRINYDLDKLLKTEQVKISNELVIGNEVLIAGEIFSLDIRETKTGKFLIVFDITDKTDSVTIKFFVEQEEFKGDIKDLIKNGNEIVVRGTIQNDDYSKELNIMAKEFCPCKKEYLRMDNSDFKRVELHLHTQMSSMDGISSAKDLINRAIKWGHKAIAITDHGVVQAFPEAMETAKGSDLKIIYGLEAYVVNDLGAVVECPKNKNFNDTFVVFDLETTGLIKESDQIIEIGAVKILNGKIIDTFSCFINPRMFLPKKIIEITGITDEMLKGAKFIEDVLPDFLNFIKDTILVAHNASFDVGFLRNNAQKLNVIVDNTVIDTLELSRTLLPNLNKHKLNIISEHLGVSLENHHRACDDAKATALIFLKFIEMLKEKDIKTLSDINVLASENIDKSKLKSYHCIILTKNYVGLRNLYELVSKSHLEFFYRRPRIPKSELIKFKEGLILGSACESGELYQAVFQKKPDEYIRELADFYDYFEIQPIDNNMFLFRNGNVSSIAELQDINKKIVKLGEIYNKLVVATCDVHFLDPHQDIFRKVIMYAEGFKDADTQAPLFFRTTEEMLLEFSYLGEQKAKEVVIDNTNKINDMIEKIKPIPDETFPPHIDGAETQIKEISISKAKEIYGENLPKIVEERLEKELNSIIKNGFSVMYIIAQKLVWKSLEDGYLVGSRGSVGSSFVATMLSITEVNPLKPHYYCSNCKFSDFDSETVKAFLGGSGCDMPDRFCPNCGVLLKKDGHDIPFETFLGFDGDKEPDIDLNFSGEYQSKAHDYTEELFGKGFVFKAGTIGTIAEKTAYGFVKKYFDEKGIRARNAEINRLKNGCTGIKRTTGQHPGGLMIVPNDHSIFEFCPIQRPANDSLSTVTTTHFDYHSISGRLLKLDILGHDVPTIIRYLHDTTGFDPREVNLGDEKVLSLFTSPKALGVSENDIECKTGSLGLPEFGTTFVRQMLLDTNPKTFAELVRISGLSHGTDVWFNNAQELIKNNIATLKEVIPTRDDIMVFLINKGVEKKAAFKIMENVRKGKGVTKEEEEIMKKANVPDWYIESCKRIKYMFPKGHAVAYVMMTVRIGYFKIYYPYSFYGASFSVKAEDFDYEIMCQGASKVREEINKIKSLGKDATTKEKSLLTTLELVLEMYARGLKFLTLDLYHSDAKKFIVTKDGLLPPLCSIQGLGINAAEGIVKQREEGEFGTIEEFRERTKTTKTVIEILKKLKILKGIPETDQLSLF